jgi:hypothetical protein
MLTEEEKTKIELQEQYRNEVSARLKTAPKVDLVEKVAKILQGLAIVIGIVATYTEYKNQNEERLRQDRARFEQTAKEFRKYFYEKQMDFYTEATDATATLATEEKGSAEYKAARKDFFRLFWGKLSIVEDKSVEDRMVEFRDVLLQYEKGENNVSQADLEQASLNLAHDASKYTINVWIDSTERSNFRR